MIYNANAGACACTIFVYVHVLVVRIIIVRGEVFRRNGNLNTDNVICSVLMSTSSRGRHYNAHRHHGITEATTSTSTATRGDAMYGASPPPKHVQPPSSSATEPAVDNMIYDTTVSESQSTREENDEEANKEEKTHIYHIQRNRQGVFCGKSSACASALRPSSSVCVSALGRTNHPKFIQNMTFAAVLCSRARQPERRLE